MTYSNDEIIKKANNCLKKGINPASAEVALGIAYFEKGSLEKALTHYLKALEINEACAEAHAGLGMSYARLGKSDKVIMHLETALKLSPDCGLIANWIADAYYDIGDLDKAISFYSEALKLDSADNNAQNDMADAYRLKGDHKTALEMYDRALAIDPGDTNALLEKAQCLVQLKEPEKALKTLRELITNFPESRDAAAAMVVCAAILGKLGRQNDAYIWFTKSLEFFPYNRMVLFQAAICAYRLNKLHDGIGFVDRILQMNPSDERAKSLLKKLNSKK